MALSSRKITLPLSSLNDLHNFPLLVQFTSDAVIGAKCRGDGLDVRFLDSTGASLTFERRSFSMYESLATGTFYVRIPTIRYEIPNTYIYIVYGDDNAVDLQDVVNTWKTQTGLEETGYSSVWPCEDANTLLEDIVEDYNALELGEPVYRQDGKIGYSVQPNNIWAYEYGFSANYQAAWNGGAENFQLSCWVAVEQVKYLAGDTVFLSKRLSGAGWYFGMGYLGGWRLRFGVDSGTPITDSDAAAIYPNGQGHSWYHVGALSYMDGSTRMVKLYLNGAVNATGILPETNAVDNEPLTFGYGSYLSVLQGNMDDIRSFRGTDPHEDNWIPYEYGNVVNEDNGLTWDAETPSSQEVELETLSAVWYIVTSAASGVLLDTEDVTWAVISPTINPDALGINLHSLESIWYLSAVIGSVEPSISVPVQIAPLMADWEVVEPAASITFALFFNDDLEVEWTIVAPQLIGGNMTAVNYNHLFEDLGKFIKVCNWLTGLPVTAQSLDSETNIVLKGHEMYELMVEVEPLFQDLMDTLVDQGVSFADLCNLRLQDRETVIDRLPLNVGASVQRILEEVYRGLVDNYERLNGSTVVLGTTVYDLADSDGVLLVSQVLDGASSPGLGWQACLEYVQDVDNVDGSGRWPGENAAYKGTYSQLCKETETFTLTCMADSESGGQEGSEPFEMVGDPAWGGPFDWRGEGSGAGGALTVMNNSGIVTNGEFEDWAVTNTPDNWTINHGTVTTNILKCIAGMKRGDACLQLKGSAGVAEINISQDVLTLTPGKRYCVACWVKGEASTTVGSLTIQMEGTGYVPGTAGIEPEQILLTAVQLSALTTWTAKSFWFNAPLNIPEDFALTIKTTGTLTAGKSVYIDSLAMAEGFWFGGLAFNILAGALPFLVGDRIITTVTNNDEGVFQKFFRKFFRFQVPAVTGGGETIPDTLAT